MPRRSRTIYFDDDIYNDLSDIVSEKNKKDKSKKLHVCDLLEEAARLIIERNKELLERRE